jgi:hypothetical protein
MPNSKCSGTRTQCYAARSAGSALAINPMSERSASPGFFSTSALRACPLVHHLPHTVASARHPVLPAGTVRQSDARRVASCGQLSTALPAGKEGRNPATSPSRTVHAPNRQICARVAPVCQPSRVADGDRERTGIGIRALRCCPRWSARPSCSWRDDCTQATKRQAPRRTVMITADCVPWLFRQMGARHGNSPGRPIRRGRSGRYHCSSELFWPVMTRED